MNRRLAKEFRPLLLPWGLAAIAAAVAPIKLLLDETMHPGDFWSMIFGLGPFAFFGSMVALGASSFGAEFQHRTLPLLLTQPLRRARMWNEKLLVLAAAALSIVLIYVVTGLATRLVAIHRFGKEEGFLTAQQTLMVGAFLIATICSCGFWTLQARSLLGGITLCIGSQVLVAIGVGLIIAKIYGDKLGGFEDSIVTRATVVVGLIYSGTFLWLGWRKFARVQLKDVTPGEGAQIYASIEAAAARIFPQHSAPWWNWVARQIGDPLRKDAGYILSCLRCRPTGATLNLIRKELRLQKPLFLLATVFSLCWLVTLMLLLVTSTGQGLYQGILNVLTIIWIPLLAVLAGCVSLGEEKALGVAEWQLTLPASARRQWLTKLLVSAAVGIVLGIGLPLGLAILTSVHSKVGLYFLVETEAQGLGLLLTNWALIFVVGFWAVTLLGTTVRAALNTAVILVGLGMAAAFGAWYGQTLDGFEKWLILPLIIHLRLPPRFFQAELFSRLTFAAFFVMPVILTALIQGLRQFRRAQSRPRVVWKYSIILLGVGFLMSLWATDLGRSWSAASVNLDSELTDLVKALPEEALTGPKPMTREITLKELEDTGKLSPLLRRWLAGATMELNSELSRGPTSKSKTRVRWLTVQFQNGLRFSSFPVIGAPFESTDKKVP